MTPILADLKREPLFWQGLILKLLLLGLATPLTQSEWFYPFIANALAHPDINLWQSYLDNMPADASLFPFPYGIVMAGAFLPLTIVGQAFDNIFDMAIFFGFGFKLTLLFFDTLVLGLLFKLWPTLRRELIWFFWLSPLAIYITYWHGQLDIVPVALLLGVFLLLKHARAASSGVAMAVAIAAKLSMLSALPLTLVYLWRNKRLHYLRQPYMAGLVIGLVVLLLPFLFMPGFQAMVLNNPEMERLYELKLVLGTRTAIYLTPIFYVLALYALWRLPRISFDLLYAATGLVFFVLIVSTAAPLGWYLWLLPFLAWHQARANTEGRLLIILFSLVVIAGHVALSTGADTPWGLVNGPSFLMNVAVPNMAHLYALWQTAITVLGCILMWRMQRETIRQNDYFRLSRRPLAIAITGDSGAGKDVFAHRLIDLFGSHSVSHLSGDSYHLWDRDGPKNITPLNPRANDLQCFTEDMRALMERRTVRVRNYDHSKGRYVAPRAVPGNDVVIVSGLHALYDDRLRPRLGVSIYLDTDDVLRRFWKIRRDVNERGYDPKKAKEALKQRQQDAATYIHPQKQNADLIFSLQPTDPERLDGDPTRNGHFKLHVVARHGLYHEHLAVLLAAVCGLEVKMTPSPDLHEIAWDIEGEAAPADVAYAGEKLLPHFAEILDNHPRWGGGMIGVMQLFALAHIDSNLRDCMP